MTRVVVAAAAELPPGSRLRVQVDEGAQITVVVFNVGGRYYALRDLCPHRGGPLSAGDLVGSLRASEPGCYDYESERRLVKCPWHGWEFDLETGQSWFDPARRRARAYPVSLEAGSALIGEDARGVRRGTDPPGPPVAAERRRSGLIEGPYVAQTVPVSVEEDYVIIELPGADR